LSAFYVFGICFGRQQAFNQLRLFSEINWS
jgi:hypothetical protein